MVRGVRGASPWNLLYGFPGETDEDYARTRTVVEAIWHLEPPIACGPLRLDRFSPYHADPARHGLVNVRPMEPFSYLYPVVDAEALADIAYYFDFDHQDGRTEDQYARSVIDLVRGWSAARRRGNLTITEDEDGGIELLDTRFDARLAPRRARLRGWKAAAYLACDRNRRTHWLLENPRSSGRRRRRRRAPGVPHTLHREPAHGQRRRGLARDSRPYRGPRAHGRA